MIDRMKQEEKEKKNWHLHQQNEILEEEIKVFHRIIGEKIYQDWFQSGDSFFSEERVKLNETLLLFMNEISERLTEIEKNKAEMEWLNSISICSCCDVVNPNVHRFCHQCGMALH